jgi:hypothetical protein
MLAMPYEIDMERDVDLGLDRYEITVGDRFTSGDAHQLCDWMSAAAQNPTVVFRVDLSRLSGPPVATMFARSSRLRERRRVEIVRELTPRAA